MNVFTHDFISQLDEALEYMDQGTEGPACLVTLSSLPKVFSAGLDLKFLMK